MHTCAVMCAFLAHLPRTDCTAEAQKSALEYCFMSLDKRWCYTVCFSAEFPSLECSVEFTDNAVECV